MTRDTRLRSESLSKASLSIFIDQTHILIEWQIHHLAGNLDMFAIGPMCIEQWAARRGIGVPHLAEHDGMGANLEFGSDGASEPADSAREQRHIIEFSRPGGNRKIVGCPPGRPPREGVGHPALITAQDIDTERTMLVDRVDDDAG